MKHVFTKILAFALATVLIISFGAPSYAYTVQKDDTLNKIAKENNVSVDDILKWNKISDKNLIYPGQEIRLKKNMTSSNKALSSEEIQILYSMFDAEYYAEKNPDVVNVVGNEEADLFEHFCTYGLYELRQPNKDFNVAAYAAAYNDLSAAFGTDVVLYYRHLYEFGKTEGRTITTMEALAATGVNAKALEEQQYTVKDENGRPQFNVFYEEGVKDFVLPALHAPEPEPEPEPEKVVRIDEIAATLKVAPTKANPWINENGYKGYWDAKKNKFCVTNEDFSDGHSTDMTDSYVLVGDNLVFEGKLARWTCIMKDGVFSAFKLEAKADSHKAFEGTYEVPVVKYTVSFDLNSQEGTAPENQKVEENSVATEPSAPTVEGYIFGGWFTDKECTTAWDFAKDTIKTDTVLFAKWTEKEPEEVTVTFNTNEGTKINPINVKKGEIFGKPSEPVKTGFDFKGWYKDAECTTEYDFTAPVEKDTTVYAKWTIKFFVVSFNLNGQEGTAPQNQDVEYNGLAEKPTNPTVEGYTFGGWYADKECATTWDFEKDTVKADVVLYAKWTVKKFQVSFDLNGKEGETPDSQWVEYNKTATLPTGLNFGWFTEAGCTTKWDFDNDTVKSDMTLYAGDASCFAAGTPIVLANGKTELIENLKIGDEVRAFNHETGEVTTAKLFDLWKYPEKQTGAFIVHFSNGIDLTLVGGHCFFEKEANKYVAVTKYNVNDYIGHLFYNMDNDCWETLESVDFLEEAVDTYIIVTENYYNCNANGMLSNEDGIYDYLINAFEYGDDLKVDEAKKTADIEKYGLWDISNLKYGSKEFYDALNLQYMSILFGKGIVTPEEFDSLVEYTFEIDPEWIGSAE